MKQGLRICLVLLLVFQSVVYAAPMDCVEAAEQTPCHEMAAATAVVVDLECAHCQDCLISCPAPAVGSQPEFSPEILSHERPSVPGKYLSPGDDIFHPPIPAQA